MPTTNDQVVYWLATRELVFATDDKASEAAYWLSFREAAEELCRAYADCDDLPDTVTGNWKTPRFERMRGLYRERWGVINENATAAFGVIRRYQMMARVRQYLGAPIELQTDGEGAAKNNEDSHAVKVDGAEWHYAKLDGNHRLMAAYFLGIEAVPVLLKPLPPPSANAGAATTQESEDKPH